MPLSQEAIEKLALLAVGWVFGLLGPAIADQIKRWRENSLGRKAIVGELRELGCLLSIAIYGVHLQHGSIDRDFVNWIKADLEDHATGDQVKSLIPMLQQMLTCSEEDFTAVARHAALKQGKGTVLQKYPALLLDARVSALWSFETSFQRSLLSIRQHINILDDLVDRTRKYHDMTFSKLEDGNYCLIVGNLEQACIIYVEHAKRTVTMIRQFTRRYA
jgi:hypothetical protein